MNQIVSSGRCFVTSKHLKTMVFGIPGILIQVGLLFGFFKIFLRSNMVVLRRISRVGGIITGELQTNRDGDQTQV